jgi:hypothetical protein
MKEKAMLILEARISIDSVDDACDICGLHKKRIHGATGTYIAGTQRWVCAECALCIDGELASFAYYPDHRVTPKRTRRFDIFDQYLGLCPDCGQGDDWKNIGSTHWFYCTQSRPNEHVVSISLTSTLGFAPTVGREMIGRISGARIGSIAPAMG